MPTLPSGSRIPPSSAGAGPCCCASSSPGARRPGGGLGRRRLTRPKRGGGGGVKIIIIITLLRPPRRPRLGWGEGLKEEARREEEEANDLRGSKRSWNLWQGNWNRRCRPRRFWKVDRHHLRLIIISLKGIKLPLFRGKKMKMFLLKYRLCYKFPSFVDRTKG